MTDGNAGKGDTYRPVDYDKYTAGWLRVFGITCPVCKGQKRIWINLMTSDELYITCPKCMGIGMIERTKDGSRGAVQDVRQDDNRGRGISSQ